MTRMTTLLAAGLAATVWLTGPAMADAQLPSSDTCLILDKTARPICELGLGYLPDSDFDDYGSAGILELDGYWDVAYFRDILMADLDLVLELESKTLTGGAGLDLPGNLFAFAVDAGITWRYIGGTALQLRAAPGLYTDLDGLDFEDVHYPCSIALVQSFDPTLAAIVGLQLRPSFLTRVMPIVGVEWQAADLLRISARLPESRISWYIVEDLSTHLGFEWNNRSYSLAESSSPDRDMLEIEDFRVFWGVSCGLSEQASLVGQLGYAFNRSVAFSDERPDADEDVNVDSTPYLRIALAGPF